jgi:RNA polymerase sigma-70 factor (ECF subfamily)
VNHSESELIERAKHDPEAFGELYDLYVDRIYTYILHRVGNPADAEDLTARTFFRALASMPTYVNRGAPFAAWLYRIAHNLVANWHRDQARRPTVSLEGLGGSVEAEVAGDGLAAATLTTALIGDAIRQLEPDRQALLVLKFSQELTNAEIAAILGRTEGAVKSLYYRTLIVLREILEQAAPASMTPHGADSEGDPS